MLHSELGRHRPGPLRPYRLPARAPGPTTWAWAGKAAAPAGLPRPKRCPTHMHRRIKSDGRRCARAGTKGPFGRPPPETLAQFAPPSLSPHPTAAAASGERRRRGERQRRRRALLAGGARGRGRRAAPSSMARGALRPHLPRARDPQIRGGDGEGAKIRPLTGLPAVHGTRRRPAVRRCGGDKGTSRGQVPGVRPH